MENDNVLYNERGEIIDILSGVFLKDTPEERVRQNFIAILMDDYGYPKNLMAREVAIQSGSKILLDESTGSEIRADIVVYNTKKAAQEKDQGNILFVVECKKENSDEGYAQLVSYIFNTSAAGGVWTNGSNIDVYRRINAPKTGLEKIFRLPRHNENWFHKTDLIPDKQNLPRPRNVRFLLASCHNKLYGRGMENEDYDLVMDMVRILLAKIQDETTPGTTPRFWITEDEYRTTEGRHHVATTIQKLFRQYADQYPDIFDEHEKIQVGDDCIVEAVGILQSWGLASRNEDVENWDLMGETYEQFTHVNLKRQQGQFFTNRLVIDMMIRILDPNIGENCLDPAGGSGGFATAIFRYLRHKVLEETPAKSPMRERQLSAIKDNVFLIEIAPRLVKIAKCAMLLTGDGQSGMTKGNSLDSYERLSDWIKSRCCAGKSNAPTVIATNPPFSGQKIESQISDPEILKNFAFGHSYKKDENGNYTFIMNEQSILSHQAPELLFLERCLDWVKDGGRIGIVLPKGILDNISYEPYRQWLFCRYEINAIITLPKDTFQPDTGVRTCILFLTKKPPKRNYKIFMAISQRIGHDSKGNPVYILDDNGRSTGKINQDLDIIADAYSDYKKDQLTQCSEYIFTVNNVDINDHYNLNPQHYMPRLNATLDRVLQFDNLENWSTTTIGQLESGIKIYIGPRWNSSSIKAIDNTSGSSNMLNYLTANAALELRRFTIKYIDVSKATPKQKESIERLRVQEGDILISRSGTIGKVTYATRDLALNYIISDDLVRVRVQDLSLRAYLVAYLTSQTALSLMRLSEYGSVQQHLQPRHIQELVIPVPDSWEQAQDLIQAGLNFIKSLEEMSQVDYILRQKGFDALLQSPQSPMENV